MNNAVEPIGRIGLAARGLVYVLVGVFAVMAAVGLRGKISDQREAIGEMKDWPMGELLLWVVAVGLAAFVLWRITQVFTTSKWTTRFIGILSGTAYAGIAFSALMQLLGSGGSGSSERSIESSTATLMAQPFGATLVILAGVGVAAAALYQFSRAITASFTKHLWGEGLSLDQQRWACRAGRLGHCARGVAFSLMAFFLIQAGLKHDAAEAGGLGQALTTLAQQPYGAILLGVVGLGLAMFGIWSMIEAKCRTQFA